MEEWRDIEGYEGLYQVSSEARVRSLDRYTTGSRHRMLKGVIMTQRKNEFGYMLVTLCKNGKAKDLRVHRLVAAAFIPKEKGKPFINHIDGNPANNEISNLEWCTQGENVQHAYDIGIHGLYGKITKSQFEYIKQKYVPYKYGARKIAADLGVDIMTVYNAIHVRQKYIKNYL